MAESSPDQFLDITSQVCPMTFVRAKLAIERMTAGQIIEIRLNSGEPLVNVPRSLAEQGHEILSVAQESSAAGTGVHRLLVRRGS
ncbi:sulfurtransferase TusA family protein [Aerophototrophica crusticola]|uniref:Sulfurtransferase TusA family protein n=1 Tax=Aerophototrophica crusticola TaxID=1709002 RepID=A0A858RA69_9PROT|nr:sulfurtransferase TusA family protein [Rhodospirillaceae bacterium B3]